MKWVNETWNVGNIIQRVEKFSFKIWTLKIFGLVNSLNSIYKFCIRYKDNLDTVNY